MDLPPLTTDLEEAKAHLEEYGLARVANALGPHDLAAAQQRIDEQAAAEAGTTMGITDGGAKGRLGGPNQWVHNLVNKGEIFRRMVTMEMLGFSVYRTLGGMSAMRPMFDGLVPRPTEFVTELGKTQR